MKRIILIILSSFFVFNTLAYANESVVPFSVQAKLPENQINTDVTYFSLAMTPGDSQTLEVIIYNSSNEEIEVEVRNTFGATNSNGVIVYDGSIDTYDESLVHPFDEISEVVESEITIAPLSQEIAYIEVDLPEESFDGHILGGIYVEQILDDQEAAQGVSIQNVYSYAIAVLIEEDGNTTSVTPEMEIEDAEGTTVNYRTAIQTTFANKTPVLISDVSLEARVYRDGAEQPMFYRQSEGFSIAPNAKFNFPVMAENRPLEAGDYVVRGHAKNEDGFEYEFEQPFTITEIEAQETNVAAIELEQPEEDQTLMYVLIGVGVLILLALVVLILKGSRRKP